MATGIYPTATMSSTTLANSIPLIWGEKVNEFFKLKLMIAEHFTNRSSELADGGSTLYTPNLTEFTATAKSNATAVTVNSPTDTRVTLTVDQWFEVSFAIEDREAAQVKRSYYLQERYAQSAGYTMARRLELALANLFQGFSTVVGASTTSLADSEIRAAISALESAGIDTTEGVAFFLSPSVFWRQVQNLDKFSLAVNTPSNDPVSKRPRATLYGIPVYVSNNIQNVSGTAGRYNALAHKDALHYATSPLGSGGSKGSSMTGRYGVRIQSNYLPEYLSTITTADLLFGVVENRDEAGVRILTSA